MSFFESISLPKFLKFWTPSKTCLSIFISCPTFLAFLLIFVNFLLFYHQSKFFKAYLICVTAYSICLTHHRIDTLCTCNTLSHSVNSRLIKIDLDIPNNFFFNTILKNLLTLHRLVSVPFLCRMNFT